MESLEYVQGAADKLRHALKQLPERTRRVYLLHRLENVSHAEVATRLGLSTRTVERDVVEAITHLKRALFPSERA
jgi:RNA polymerase sigma factor (sigma-70 family)